jgi:hypothetical protein
MRIRAPSRRVVTVMSFSLLGSDRVGGYVIWHSSVAQSEVAANRRLSAFPRFSAATAPAAAPLGRTGTDLIGAEGG